MITLTTGDKTTGRRLLHVLPYLALAVLAGIAEAAGLCTASPGALFLSLACLVGCAVLAYLRPRVRARIAAAAPLARGALAACLLLGISVLCVFEVELPWNADLQNMPPESMLLNVALVGLAVTGLYFLFGRRGRAAAPVIVLCLVLGIAEYFVYRFKGAFIRPADILALSTATSVAAGYDYTIDGRALEAIACACLAWSLASLLVAGERPREGRRRRVLANLAAALACFVALGALVCVPDYSEDFGIEQNTWFNYENHSAHGFIPSFISAAQHLAVEPPSGYSDEAAGKLTADYAAAYDAAHAKDAGLRKRQEQFAAEKPTVIAVMNESFTDLSTIYGDLSCGYTGTGFFKNSLDDALAKGRLNVSVMGGGTCNSEFEFLTGDSLALFGPNIDPYELYSFDTCDSIVAQFEALGYSTSALHPNFASNWRRDSVYNQLGFDRFYSIEDFAGADTLRGEVTDAATYDKVLDLLEQDDGPQFIFDVTMQNHGGYDTGEMPSAYLRDYRPSAIDDAQTVASLNEYLACIRASDEALADFVSELRDLDRPVILVFFGDHQPSFAPALNDALFPGYTDVTEHTMRTFQANYALWANYDVAGMAQKSELVDTSAAYLASGLLESMGAPLSDYQKAQLTWSESIPEIGANGYQTADGTWHALGGDAEDGQTSNRALDDALEIEYLRVKESFSM